MEYQDFQVEDAPSWLQNPKGRIWNAVLGLMKQAAREAAVAAVKMRFASTAALDALPHLLEDRNLDPAWNETETSVRARIRKAWVTWMLAGTKLGVGEALKLAGYTNFDIREANTDGTLAWWQFEVFLFTPFPWPDEYLADGRWDDPGVWDDGGVWATDLPAPDLTRLRALIKKWKPTHSRCRAIVLVHAGETWDADGPTATWDDVVETWGNDVSVISP